MSKTSLPFLGSIMLYHPCHVTIAGLNPLDLDKAMRTYLPASAEELRLKLAEKVQGCDFSDVETVSELLIMLSAVDSNLPAIEERWGFR